MNRVPTGIKSLDNLLCGGYPEGKSILVTGSTGAGKTILGLHFIYHGCADRKKCTYIATDENPEDLINQSRSVSLDISGYIQNGCLTVHNLYEEKSQVNKRMINGGYETDDVKPNIISLVDYVSDIDIAVVDNLGFFITGMSRNEFRVQFDTLNNLLSKLKVTILFILDKETNKYLGNVACYSCYGILNLVIRNNPFTNKRERSLEILKMRNTNISLDPYIFTIDSEGIIIGV